MASQAVEAAPEVHKPASKDSEEWSTQQYSLRVTSKDGFFCTIRLAALLPLSPAETFELLARPDSHNIFRSITDNTYRKVVKWHDRRRGQVKVETEALAKWRFAMFSGKFATRLYVDLDRPAGTIDFELAQRGGQMMKAFEGHWAVQKYDGRTPLEAIVAGPPSSSLARRGSVGGNLGGSDISPSTSAQDALQNLQALTGMGYRSGRWFQHQPGPQRTLVTLEQSLQPGLVPPGPLGSLVKSISAAQVKGMLEDLQTAAAKIRDGTAAPSGSSDLEVEFGFEGAGIGGAAGGGSSASSGVSSPAGRSTPTDSGRWGGLPGGGGGSGGVGLLTASAARARARRLRWLRDVGLDPG